MPKSKRLRGRLLLKVLVNDVQVLEMLSNEEFSLPRNINTKNRVEIEGNFGAGLDCLGVFEAIECDKVVVDDLLLAQDLFFSCHRNNTQLSQIKRVDTDLFVLGLYFDEGVFVGVGDFKEECACILEDDLSDAAHFGEVEGV